MSCIETHFANGTDAKADYDNVGRSFLDGTASWVLGEKSFQAWFEDETPFLWISGFPGSGKSHLAYFLAKHLLGSINAPTRTSVAYFFLKNTREETRSIKTALCSCVIQIALADDTYRKQVAADLSKTKFERDSPSLGSLWDRYF